MCWLRRFCSTALPFTDSFCRRMPFSLLGDSGVTMVVFALVIIPTQTLRPGLLLKTSIGRSPPNCTASLDTFRYTPDPPSPDYWKYRINKHLPCFAFSPSRRRGGKVWRYMGTFLFARRLDCVSRAHEIEICPSIIRPSGVLQLSLKPIARIYFQINFNCTPMCILLCFKKSNTFSYFSRYFFSLSLIRSLRNKNFKTLLLFQIASELLLNRLSNGHHKSTV